MKHEITEFSKYFNGNVDTVTERFLLGIDVAYDDSFVDWDFEELKQDIKSHKIIINIVPSRTR